MLTNPVSSEIPRRQISDFSKPIFFAKLTATVLDASSIYIKQVADFPADVLLILKTVLHDQLID